MKREKSLKLKNLRKKIDQIDHNLVWLLKERFKLVQKIAQLKKKEGIPIADKDRETEILNRLRKKAKIAKISPDFIEKLFKMIFQESICLQKSCVNELIHEVKNKIS